MSKTLDGVSISIMNTVPSRSRGVPLRTEVVSKLCDLITRKRMVVVLRTFSTKRVGEVKERDLSKELRTFDQSRR